MDSTESERSLSGISLPQWMKSKIADRYDLDQSTFSPPSEDDSFFFIRYPKAKSVEPQPLRSSSAAAGDPVNYRSINEVLQNHTVPCRQFIAQAKTTPHELGLRKINDPPLGRIKSTGTDDGFTGEGAACGHSVVAVAHQMISGKLNISHKSYSDDENLLVNNLSVNRTTVVRQRRNSKSLPASPQGSPKMLRRNPYFTNILLGSTDKLENGAETSGKSGWLTNILGVRDSHEDLHSNTATTDDHIQFSDQEEPMDSPTLKPKVGQTFKAKPSELREMNFWSPTSM